MIRYVLAVAIAVALLVLAVPAIDYAAVKHTDRTLESDVGAIDDAATSLTSTDEVSLAGHPDPRRVVTITLPDRTLTSAGVDHLEIVPNETHSTARYVLEDGTTRRHVLTERIVRGDPDGDAAIELSGPAEVQLVLTLRADETGEPVVVVDRP